MYGGPYFSRGWRVCSRVPGQQVCRVYAKWTVSTGYRVCGSIYSLSFSVQFVTTVMGAALVHSRGMFIRKRWPSGDTSYRFQLGGMGRVWKSSSARPGSTAPSAEVRSDTLMMRPSFVM